MSYLQLKIIFMRSQLLIATIFFLPFIAETQNNPPSFSMAQLQQTMRSLSVP
jgi:hypothetical protein